MKKKDLKIVVIGGGSSYTPELIEGLIQAYPMLPVKDLYLVDIEEGGEKLEIIGNLAKRMIKKYDIPINVHLTYDRRIAIKDADFITTQIRVGMLEARSKDEMIPLRYNCIGQETTGAGGFAKALRTVPVILDICKDIEELAPEAFLLNFTNPAGIVTEAVIKYTNVKTIGLCNLPIGTKMQVADWYDVELKDVQLEMVGINHLNWTTKIMVKKTNVTTDILNNSRESELQVRNIPNLEWDRAFLKSLKALPCAYHRYYYMKDKMLEDQKKKVAIDGNRAKVVMEVEKSLFEKYKDPELQDKPKELENRGGAYYSEAAIQLITSIYCNKGDTHIVNVKNNGIIPFLPSDVSVEVNCMIDSNGAHPIQISTPIEPHIKGLMQVVKAYEELTVKSAAEGNYEAGLQALTIHPLVGDVTKAKQIFKDILYENANFLPQFH
ncbi:6-phospho-beta-glucosidase [Halolactibacillus alkaliphilus]|uniref:6-phospho-beta-glucosidase n=1 Tax=Halolactibacillus alkaliphilus TaxID=442899 RepID=A0A511WZT0_9BACI|nr:6-phospho-beta-glucosidase [Halolactibacillus alkaliphilus]GEN56203.1 6-phospho-beta-glucosidase [Halolactibacillus alkaliphilus]GGN66591.1 6-phospho-beta-glucosidase [Halolactibacillus alkaliphilus]SFO67949.1 6-phospho-beta-glucosidase [Halolactibacillus alkaliphilus]